MWCCFLWRKILMYAGRLAGITCWSPCHILTFSGSGQNSTFNTCWLHFYICIIICSHVCISWSHMVKFTEFSLGLKCYLLIGHNFHIIAVDFVSLVSVISRQLVCLVSVVFCPHFYRAAWNADAVLRWDFCPSVCLSIHLSNACIVTKRKKDMFRFLYHTKEHLS